MKEYIGMAIEEYADDVEILLYSAMLKKTDVIISANQMILV